MKITSTHFRLTCGIVTKVPPLPVTILYLVKTPVVVTGVVSGVGGDVDAFVLTSAAGVLSAALDLHAAWASTRR